MENRSHALLAGLFTLLLMIAGAVGAVWVSKKNLPLLPYELVATSPVTGLSEQSTVRYQGVPVGRVQSLRFMPDKPGQVRILIGVDPTTPLTESSWAEIVSAGVTGISNVELRDDGKSTKRLVSSAGRIQDIPEFDIIVIYLDAALITRKHVLKNVRFMNNKRASSSGDTSIPVDLELILSHVQYL